MLTLIAFEGCPTTPRVVSLLTELGVPFDRVDQDSLPTGHPFRSFSSPTLLRNGEVLLGSRTDGDTGCSLALPSDEKLRKILREAGLSV
jgi:hypothetical protein